MKLTHLIAGALAVSATAAMPTAATECGRITIADMNWASAEFAAYLDKHVLEAGYGCTVELVPGDTVPTSTSMVEKGEPDIAPEIWPNAAMEQIDAAVKQGRLIRAAEILTDGGEEGWWIPEYFARKHPDIKTVEDALTRRDLFPHPEDSSKGALYGCPAGWNCEIVTRNLFQAYAANDKGFELVDPGSAAGLDGAIAKAYEREQPWLGYYWAPTAILGKYPMVRLDWGVAHDPAEWERCTLQPDCRDPKTNAWAKSRIFTVMTPKVAESAPAALDYLKQRQWSNEIANEVLAYMADNQYTGEEGARYFLERYESLWSGWVSDDVAAKVKAAL